MDRISRSRRLDKEIPHCVLPMEQLVLSDKWARIKFLRWMHHKGIKCQDQEISLLLTMCLN